jgi:hypothetical protein
MPEPIARPYADQRYLRLESAKPGGAEAIVASMMAHLESIDVGKPPLGCQLVPHSGLRIATEHDRSPARCDAQDHARIVGLAPGQWSVGPEHLAADAPDTPRLTRAKLPDRDPPARRQPSHRAPLSVELVGVRRCGDADPAHRDDSFQR